ncbi:hypothetical protein VPH35_059997 [Triticum aestivum]|uniref:Uncharacterized protein n=1 Tax=Aegilops tauschii TaxID=37682 RepID=M8BH28_AEGTA
MRRHLYVVLENHRDNGFEIQKLDMDDGDSGSTLRRLPEPVVRGGTGKSLNFAALCSTIIAMDHGTWPDGGATIIHDTNTAELATSNLLPRGLISGCDLAVAVGSRLYAFESHSDNDFRCPACEGGRGTFTHATGSSKWKRRSDWELPFIGPAHYDGDLDAWVRLQHADTPDNDGSETTDGHLFACRVMSATSASRQLPEWRVGGETLFREDPGRRRSKVQLVYVGRRNE